MASVNFSKVFKTPATQVTQQWLITKKSKFFLQSYCANIFLLQSKANITKRYTYINWKSKTLQKNRLGHSLELKINFPRQKWSGLNAKRCLDQRLC